MMRPPIDGGVVVLTGASSGIGASMARLLAPRAKALVLVARREARLRALAETLPGTVDVQRCDLTDLDAASQMLNVVSLTYLTRAVLPGMVSRGRGGTLNVSSGFGLTWMPFFTAYVGSKNDVSAFTESLRAELYGTGVVVSHLCPGPVATEFEQRAGNPFGRSVPDFVQISADSCARQGVWGFEYGWARIVPGGLMWSVLMLGRLTPTWLLRTLYGPLASRLRKQL